MSLLPTAAAPAPGEILRFPALAVLPGVVHGFVGRVPGIDVTTDRATALARLEITHTLARSELGIDAMPFVTAEQVHGNAVAVIRENNEPLPAQRLPGVDGILTNRLEVCLGIYVADCCAVFLVDVETPAIGLVHAGKKGTQGGIVPAAITALRAEVRTDARSLHVQLSPCIRPPFYEWDFAAEIRAQCVAAGVPAAHIHDDGENTGADLSRFYSYRMERGHTGRMLALLALRTAAR